jgi:acyl-CoA thioesterase FadM
MPLLRHHFFTRARPHGPSSLFQPLICSSRSPLLECDYNFHKSNSTYFSDLDLARSKLISCLLPKYFDTLRNPSKEDRQKGSFSFALGAVTCQFKREIKPYQKYEMWTRVLSWDCKWLYLVTHIVVADRIKPSSYTLQPWKKSSNTPKLLKIGESTGPTSAILATSVARYVFKRGRVTIPVDSILTAAGLLPAKPDGPSPAPTSTLEAKNTTTVSERVTVGNDRTKPSTDIPLKPESGSDKWDWDRIEEERQRGWKIAQLVAGLDGAYEEFTGDSQPALGKY